MLSAQWVDASKNVLTGDVSIGEEGYIFKLRSRPCGGSSVRALVTATLAKPGSIPVWVLC